MHSSQVRQTVDGYDRTAAGYAARWGDLRLERALHAFASRITGPRRVLDLGCGPGRDVAFLTQLGCRVVGLDLSVGMLHEARRRLPAALLVGADLRRPPFAAASFDGVWACASLLHLLRADLPAALAEVARLLRHPGGLFYLALKGGQGEGWVAGPGGDRAFFTYYRLTELETMLHRAGFCLLERWIAPDQAGRERPWLNLVAEVGSHRALQGLDYTSATDI